jgi:hypothetical protein
MSPIPIATLTGPASVATQDGYGRALLVLTDQVPRDQEPGNDEEDVDPDESPADAGYVGVIEHHEQDGDRTKPLNVRSELPRGRRLLRRHGCGRSGRNDFGDLVRACRLRAGPIALRQHSERPFLPTS